MRIRQLFLKRNSVKTAAIMSSAILALAVFLGNGISRWGEASAASTKKETVDLRIIGTTDIHGQLNSKDYELGVDYNYGGLARVFDLIQQARAELPKGHTITLDAGDTLFDYTTEYIFSENQQEIQPIYKAMAKMGYDAITLGNHDFDYGYEYILRQLDGTGLRDITVVSNVMDSKTGEHPFLENMLITRKMKTSSGREVEIKVGIIGQTIPVLTPKTHSYTGILRTQNMIDNAREQADKLKEMGADIVVVVSHTGIGPEDPDPFFKNVAYALTKIPNIDVVVCGHEHNLFPTADMTSPYYKLPGVDSKTYLINGKNLIMAGDRGSSIGLVDLTLDVTGDKVEIVKRSSSLRMVTPENTKEDKSLAAMFGTWEEKLLEYSTDIIGELPEGKIIENYYGLLGDNQAIQLLNDSKLHYALHFAKSTGGEYKNYPIIAASGYASFGAKSIHDYVTVADTVTEAELSAIQPYNDYLYIYTITGKQLKEWLEWTASAYEKVNGNTKWNDPAMSSLITNSKLRPLIQEEWMEDWSNFYVFDGIDYVINPEKEPRYDFSGNKISNSRRITSVTYMGEEVSDTMTFLLATNKITKPTDANSGVETQVAKKGFIRSQSVLRDYVKQIAKNGAIAPEVDYNWSVKMPQGYQFIIRAPYYADSLFRKTPWFVSEIVEHSQYKYYTASYSGEKKDTEGPKVIVSPISTGPTKSAYEVAVLVADASKVKMARVVSGIRDKEYIGWIAGEDVLNKSFIVRKNESYSVYAEDIHGNISITPFVIDNFRDDLLDVPTVVTYTNRKTRISGKAEPNKTIVFEAYTGTYETLIGGSGNFAYDLPGQPSDTTVKVYIVDRETGLESERVIVPVKRTGPNQPTVNPITNTVNSIQGMTNDKDAQVIAIIGDNVYVSKDGGKERFEKNKEIYSSHYRIIETESEVGENEYFRITLPPLEAGTAVSIYSLDHLSRNSRVVKTTVTDAGPNAPVVYEVSNIEKGIRGYIPKGAGKHTFIFLNVDGNVYSTMVNKNGEFEFEITDQLTAGKVIEITALDFQEDMTRYSYTTKAEVIDIRSKVRNNPDISLNRITSQSNFIVGSYEDGGTVYLAITQGEGEEFKSDLYLLQTDEFNRFRLSLENKLVPGTKVYAMSRFSDGKILYADMFEVVPGVPDRPILVREITNSDKQVEIYADMMSEVILTIGKKTYRTKEYREEEATGRYIYTLTVDRSNSGTSVKVQARTELGSSETLSTKIVKAAPDSPRINPVKAGDTVITGMAEKSQTGIFAKIGSKTYEGTIDKKGQFTITVPKQKAGTQISVWGTNNAGRGPLDKVVVTK